MGPSEVLLAMLEESCLFPEEHGKFFLCQRAGTPPLKIIGENSVFHFHLCVEVLEKRHAQCLSQEHDVELVMCGEDCHPPVQQSLRLYDTL